jgi:hypothetical protein
LLFSSSPQSYSDFRFLKESSKAPYVSQFSIIKGVNMLSFVNALLYPHGLYAELDVKGDDTRRKDFDFSIPNGLVFRKYNSST